MENKGLLVIIAVVLIGIFTVLMVQMNQEQDFLSYGKSNSFEHAERNIVAN